ncbi:MAG: arylesterase [Nitrospirota bacterium]
MWRIPVGGHNDPAYGRIAHSAAWGWLLCAAVGAADARGQPGPTPTIVAFGDSLTAGFGVPGRDAYPSRLERRLRGEGYAHRVVNAGVSGDTTAGGLRRVDWVLKSRPQLVILELGANDGLRGLSPAQTRDNLARIIERLQASGATVVLTGMRVPPNYGDDYARAFESVFPELARRYHLPLIPFFLDGVAADPALNQADGLHPTAEGYRVIVERIWPHIKPLLPRP